MAQRFTVSIGWPAPINLNDSQYALLGTAINMLLGFGGQSIQLNPPAVDTVPESFTPAPIEDATLASVSMRFLEDLGAPVDDTRLAMVAAWIRSEKPPGQPAQWNNPMNTTLSTGAAVQDMNSVGVKEYATIEDGISANVATLNQNNMSHIRNALLNGDPAAFVHGFRVDPWGSPPELIAQILGV